MAQADPPRGAGTGPGPVPPAPPEPGSVAAPAGVHPPEPADGGLDQAFDREALVSLRSAVAAHGADLGLPAERLDLLVVVAHELASNAVRHGGGRGRLRLWRLGDVVYCRVSDAGPGIVEQDPRGWHTPPPASAEGGRGLYFVQVLADSVVVDSEAAGTTITASFALR
jgi:anti-sigma regulatory factor (Ser/Thr protein kinase)